MPSSTGSELAAARAPRKLSMRRLRASARVGARRIRRAGVCARVRPRARTATGRSAGGAAVGATGRHRGQLSVLDDPHWERARRAMDAVWFVASEETMRVERLVARHIRFGKSPDEARSWVATTDQRNSELVAATVGRADRVIINGTPGWGLG